MKLHLTRVGAAMLTLTAAFSLFTGCADNSSGSGNGSESSVVTGTIYSPQVPDSKVDENTPGEEKDTVIGETVDYQDKVSVNLNRVIEFDKGADNEYRYFVAELSITNKTADPLDCSSLTHFALRINGEDDTAPLRNVSASVFARKYYTKIDSGMVVINQAIPAGATATGYVYYAAPKDVSSLRLVYTPYKYYNTDKLLFEIADEKLTHYTEELS